MCAPMEQLNTLWRELGYIVVAEDEDSLIISKPFLHFPAGTPVSDIWTGSKTVIMNSSSPKCFTANQHTRRS